MIVKFRMTSDQHQALKKHLFPGDGLEAVAIVVCGRHDGDEISVLTAQKVVPVPYDECSVRAEDRVTWSTDVIDRLIGEVWKSGLSLVKIHSHPEGYERFSSYDDESDQALSLAWDGLFEEGRLHGSAVMLPDDRVFGRALIGGELGEPFDSVMVVGDDIKFWSYREAAGATDQDKRNTQAFGEGTVNIIKNLRAAVIGASGTGSVTIEQLARLGLGEFVPVDPDKVEEKNLNRILNATKADADNGIAKVDLVKRTIDSLGRGQVVLPLQLNLDSREAVQRVAECDVIFGCVDSAEGRNLANRIAAFYLIPYFDVGVSLAADGHGGIANIAGAVNYYRPGGATLLERSAYSTEQLRAEAMRRTDPEQYAELRRQKYIRGVNEDRPAVISVNTLFAALIVNEFLARIHGFRNVGNEEFTTVRGDLCEYELFREGDVTALGHLQKELGRGGREPLLGMPHLSKED